MVNVHKGCEDYCDSSDVNQVAEQAVLAKNALSLADYAGNNCSSSNGVEVWHDVSSAEILEEVNDKLNKISLQRKLTIPRSAK